MLGVAIGKHQVKIHLVDELETGFAVGVVVVEIGLEKWVAFVVEKCFCDLLIPRQKCRDDLVVRHLIYMQKSCIHVL